MKGHQILSMWYHQIRRILFKYLLSVSNGQPDSHRILSAWYRRIRWILSRYLLVVCNGQPDMPLNIICVVWSDQADTVQIFTQCR